jgi:hypothetical protein
MAVVGHTNTGKTSLLRTLTRDRAFGDVDDAPGTTRHVQSAAVMLDGQTVLVWFDTPGLEDSVSLRDYVEGFTHAINRLDNHDRIERFLSDPLAQTTFEQEHRVLTQAMRSDALLYVVDARDPVLAKHRDELFLLQACARPVLPVLNFVASPEADIKPWVQMFARQAIHVYLQFDSISPPVNGQQMMYDTLGQLLVQHQSLFKALSSHVAQERRHRMTAAIESLSWLCVAVAATSRMVKDETAVIEQAINEQQQEVRQQEQALVGQLLALYEFDQQDYLPATEGWQAGQWQADVFAEQTLASLGIKLGTGAAVGAAAGAVVDVLSAGLSLGTGTLIGAAAGSAWQSVDRFGRDVAAKWRGQRPLMVSDAVVLAIATRNIQLIVALEQRGHASHRPVTLKMEPNAQPAFDHKALVQAIAPVRQQSLKRHMLAMMGATASHRATQLAVKQVLSQSVMLQPFVADGLH